MMEMVVDQPTGFDWGEGSGLIASTTLRKTRSTFLTEDMVVERHGKNIIGRVPAVFVAFFLTVFITFYFLAKSRLIFNGGVYSIFTWEAAIFGFLFIVAGWLEFSLLEEIEGIPTAKIEAAAEGLNEIQGDLIPEKGTMATSPITKQKCIAYQVELQELMHTKNSTYWMTVAMCGDGIPTLLTDKTGYLAIDMANADTDNKNHYTRYYVADEQDKEVRMNDKLGDALQKYISSAPEKFDASTVGVTFTTSPQWKFELFGGGIISVLETIMGADTNQFAMGRVIGTSHTLSGKEVKGMIYDKRTKTLSLRGQSKDSLERKDRTLTYVAFGFGALLLIAALGLLIG